VMKSMANERQRIIHVLRNPKRVGPLEPTHDCENKWKSLLQNEKRVER